MECSSARESGEFLLIARRNNSLSSTGRSIVLGSLVSLSFAISLAFAVVGAWLVLPFAGAEMVVLVLAFRYIERHSGDFESIALKGDSVLVEKWELGAVRRYEFTRCAGAPAPRRPGGREPRWRWPRAGSGVRAAPVRTPEGGGGADPQATIETVHTD